MCDVYGSGNHMKSLPDFYEQIVDTALDQNALKIGEDDSENADDEDELTEGFNTSRFVLHIFNWFQEFI